MIDSAISTGLVKKISNRKWTLAILLAVTVFLAGGIIFSVVSYSFQEAELLSSMNHELHIGADAIRYLLPRDFHDRALQADSISAEEDEANIRKLSTYCQTTGFTFLYSLIQTEGVFYITSSSATKEELDSGTQVKYFETFPEAYQQFHLAIEENRPLNFTHQDRWGEFRAAVVPETSPSGRSYLSVAEYDISHVRGKLQRMTIRNLFMCGLFLVSAAPMIYIVIVHDRHTEAERRRLLKENERVSRLEAVGRLAGGVAHDFNNLLMGMMNYVDLCRDEVAAEHPIRKWLDEIMKEAERSAGIVRQLLAFSRKQAIEPKELNLNDMVSDMLKMLRRMIGEDVEIRWMPSREPTYVCMDPGQIDQILANLCVNASDAIGGVGRVTIETDLVSLDQEYCDKHKEATPGKFVMLKVSDDGCGMDRETLANIFEPFFTTKPESKGTGLGLATVYGIVKQNHGLINVRSESGEGTTFCIYIPSIDEPLPKTEPSAVSIDSRGGGETILLVEDESAIRKSTCILLETAGYVVIPAETPEKALQLVKTIGGDVELIITDVVMPGKSGPELAEELTNLYPNIKILYMSGYTSNFLENRGHNQNQVNFLSKPFSREVLLTKVYEVLNQ